MIYFTLRALLPGKSTPKTIEEALAGPQSWSERFVEEKTLAHTGIQTLDRSVDSLVAVPTTLHIKRIDTLKV